ncbi:MAG: DUF1028 domain-containing protein [Thaumarchaeota archaeon]|nr:DUF1028 domain-containing protein [Nitrososphaerota archaeon]
MTFSIIARGKKTGDFGAAVASRMIRVGALVVHARANLGALATQNARTEPFRFRYGQEGLRMLEEGLGPKDVVKRLLAVDGKSDQMQLSVLDKTGQVESYTGKSMPEWAGHIAGDNFSVQGNLLAGEGVVRGMYEAYTRSEGHGLAERLLRALEGGDAAGGDRRGKQAAGLIVVREFGGPNSLSDKLVDLRVDDNVEPFKELRRLLSLHDQTNASRGWATS